MRVIGLMSGTSFDAVDAAAMDIDIVDDRLRLLPLGMVSQTYPQALKAALIAALPPAQTTMHEVCRIDTEVGQAFAELANRANRELCGNTAELIVSHGQTVYHWVENDRVQGSLQLGQPAWIAEGTGVPVVSDLRSRDIAAGGQGAPLVSAFDVLWLSGRKGVSAALNLGGIANVTLVGADREPVAFDTGPANALIDAVVQRETNGELSFDRNGELARAGRVDHSLLAELLAEPYYARAAPKSTGKELFNLSYVDAHLGGRPTLEAADLVATLTALTARTVADVLRNEGVDEVIAAGGGTRNPVLMGMLAAELPNTAVLAADDLGIPSGAKEAYAFGFLGFCTVAGLAATVPSCTGAEHGSLLGSVTPGRDGLPSRVRGAGEVTSLEVVEPTSKIRP